MRTPYSGIGPTFPRLSFCSKPAYLLGSLKNQLLNPPEIHLDYSNKSEPHKGGSDKIAFIASQVFV
jgi:hypothetical protein